jgi:hypothetical protein
VIFKEELIESQRIYEGKILNLRRKVGRKRLSA